MSTLSEVEKWKFRRLMKNLNSMKGNGTSLISLIIKAGYPIALSNKMLTTEYGTASNIKSRVNRLSVLSAITSVQHVLKKYNKTPVNGLAIFCGLIMTEDGKERKVNIVLDNLPKPVNKPLYKCDKQFHTECLEELLSDGQSYGFIVLSGKSCLYATVNGNSKHILQEFSENIPGKTRRGGQSALRFDRLRDEAVHNFIRKAAEGAVMHYIEDNMPNVAGIVLAGSADRKMELERSDLLDPRLKKIIVARVDTSYPGDSGLRQAIEMTQDVFSDLDLNKEIKLLREFMEEISKDSDLYCFGLKQTVSALEAGAVDKLIVWSDLEAKLVKYRDMDGVEHREFLSDKDFLALETSGRLAEVTSSEALTEWLAENYKEFGTSLHFVSDSSGEGSQFCRGFGGIGGTMRWKLDLNLFEEPLADQDEFDDFEDFI